MFVYVGDEDPIFGKVKLDLKGKQVSLNQYQHQFNNIDFETHFLFFTFFFFFFKSLLIKV